MTTTPRTPRDRQKPAAAIAAEQQKSFEEVDGHEHIVPFSKIKGSDQLRIISRIQKLGLGDDTDESSIDMDGFADFIDWIGERYTVDQEKFELWSAGQGGIGRTMKLAMALLGELGKGMQSDNS